MFPIQARSGSRLFCSGWRFLSTNVASESDADVDLPGTSLKFSHQAEEGVLEGGLPICGGPDKILRPVDRRTYKVLTHSNFYNHFPQQKAPPRRLLRRPTALILTTMRSRPLWPESNSERIFNFKLLWD